MVAALSAALVDVARAGGGIKGDEATFVGLAASAGLDGDLTFTADDYQRFRAWYGSGPEGIFLKQGADGRLYFGKAYLYGVLAAPFALGGPRGLFFFNLACLVAVGFVGYRWLHPGSRPVPALAFTGAFLLASVVPLYAFWLTAETLNFALVFVAFGLTVAPPGGPAPSRAGVLAGALCLGAAIFSKPLNLPLALPFALAVGRLSVPSASSVSSAALVPSVPSALSAAFLASAPSAAPVRSAAALASVALVVAGLFAVNAALTGELNYQGGDRKTFYGRFPFDETGQSFETTGIGMTTNTVQTPVGDEGRLAPLAENAWYFVAGRHFGLIPFGWPWIVALGLWLAAERRKTAWQWALVGSIALAAFITIVWMPYTWSGGGGPVGNRYFLSLGAATFFLVPRVRTFVPAAIAAAGLVFVAPSLSTPFTVAKQPWLATRAPVFDALPIEITSAADLPAILDQRRGRIPQGRNPTVFVSLLDESGGMGQGGWLSVAAHETSELLVRSPTRLPHVTVGVKSPQACQVVLRSGGPPAALTLRTGDRQDIDIVPAQTFSRDSFAFVLGVDASGCSAPIEVALQGRTQAQ